MSPENPQSSTIVIVGGGPAGLAAGIYARQAGFNAVILERHNLPGGLCAAWKRRGYTIDGCVHFVMGSGPGSTFHELWKELGLFESMDPEKDFVYMKDLFHIRFADGQEITISSDPEAMAEELGQRYPADRRQLRRFARAVRSLAGFEPPVDLLRGGRNLYRAAAKSWRYALPLLKWKNTSIESFADGFKSRELRESFIRLWYPSYNMLYILLIVDWLKKGLAGYPLKNSLGVSRALEASYLKLGGEIRYSAGVAKVLEQDGRAAGVRLEDGSEVRGDYVIHTAASPEVLRNHLGRDGLRGRRYDITPPLVHLVFGSSYDFSDYESAACGQQLELAPPVVFEEEAHEFLLIHIYNFAPGDSPEGRTQVKVMFPSRFDRWMALRDRGEVAYRAEKERISGLVLEVLDRYYPGFSGTVDMTDVSTPLTFHRYTANQEGALIAWAADPKTPMMLKKTIPGLRNLYLAGHWVMPGGGVPQAAMSARHAVQAVVMDEKRRT